MTVPKDPFVHYSEGMPELVDARDVLDTNAHIKAEVRVQVLGHFERTGPNSWDNYQFVPNAQGPITVLPGIPIQLEKHGVDFRVRKEGRVLRVRWIPGEDDPAEINDQSNADQRSYFLRTYIQAANEAAGVGAAAWIAGTLRD